MDFGEFAGQPDSQLDVVTGALLVARDAHPTLDVETERERVVSLARPLLGRGLESKTPVQQALALADLLFQREGFRGNVDDYYHPSNSYLNEVMASRRGIPISLSLIYCEVAQRLGIDARGVSFPGHFLVRIEGATPVFVDPFDRGALLDRRGITALWARIGGGASPLEEQWLEPAPARAILVRLLMNLRGAYAMRGDFPALLIVLDRSLELVPDSPPEIRDRGLVALKLGALEGARCDLERYLELERDAGDVAEVRRVVEELSKHKRPLN